MLSRLNFLRLRQDSRHYLQDKILTCFPRQGINFPRQDQDKTQVFQDKTRDKT